MTDPTVPDGARPGHTWRHEDGSGAWLARLQRSGAVVLFQHEPSQAWIDSRVPVPPLPDPDGLIAALFARMGATKARAMVSGYPDVKIGLETGNWPLFHAAIADMLSAGFVTAAQHTALQGMLAEYRIPAAA